MPTTLTDLFAICTSVRNTNTSPLGPLIPAETVGYRVHIASTCTNTERSGECR